MVDESKLGVTPTFYEQDFLGIFFCQYSFAKKMETQTVE